MIRDIPGETMAREGISNFRFEISACVSQWRTEGGGLGGSTPPPEIPKFYKVEPDCKLSGKCLVFLFQQPN
jgi:hypothetical protein